MVTRRQIGTTTLALTAGVLSGCGTGSDSAPNAPGNTTPRPEGAPELTWKGTITMAVQAYTPAVQGVRLQPGSVKLQAFGELAQQFQALYPGITIKFLGAEYSYDPNMQRTQAAGGQLPDIWWQQYAAVNASFPKGVATNLLPIMQKPNPFIPGNTKWQDVFNPQIFTQTLADNETQYVNNGDFVSTAFFYNEDLFAQAGITATPKTWDELIAVCQKLKDAGINPSAMPVYAGGCNWFTRLFLANFLGLSTLEKIDGFSPAKGISVADVAIAWHQGLIDPRKNPAVLAWWPQAKQLYDFFDRTVSQLPASAPPGSPDWEKMFAAGKVAMLYTGSWIPTNIRAAGSQMKIGSFNWPNLQGSNPSATSFDSSNSVGGPNAAWQFYISTEKSDKTLQEPGKLDAVIAWMQFFTTPENNAKVANENGSFLPTLQGAKPLDSMKDIVGQIDQPLYGIQGGQEFSTEAGTEITTLFQRYILEQVSMEEVQTAYVAAAEKGFNAYVKEHPIDFSKYE